MQRTEDMENILSAKYTSALWTLWALSALWRTRRDMQSLDEWNEEKRAHMEEVYALARKMKALSILTGSDVGLGDTENYFMDGADPEAVNELLNSKWLRDLDVKGLMRMN